MIPKAAVALFGCALLAASAFAAAGEFQQTRDGKTMVWNGTPRPGESAAWAGARDKEGYATGFGTITWYTNRGTVYAVYYGNMIHGKFDGPVNAHSRGKVAHAYFADGGRVTPWARGAAPGHPEPNWPLRAKPVELANPEETAPSTEVTSEPKAKKPKPEPEKVRQVEEPITPAIAESKPKPPPTAVPVEENIQVPTPEPSVAPTNPPPIAETTTISTPEPIQTQSSLFESTPVPSIAETPAETRPETPQAASSELSTPEPSAQQTPEIEAPPPTEKPATKSSTEKNGSISALAGPPSSLRSSIPESNDFVKSETKTKSRPSGTRGVADLSENDVVELADAEARTRGYDLNEYQRPKADYSAVKDKWSLFYNLKDPKVAGGDLQPFSVTVEDKTKKVEIRRNY